MPHHLSSSPPGDAEEPDSSPLPPAAEEAGPDWEGPAEQGLYICLPAEQLTLAGFAQGGQADTMAPGPLLATIVDTVAGPVAQRLPQTFAALGAGRIHPIHVRIIEDETRFLSEEDAAKADAMLAGAAPGLTFGELRAAARKLVLKLDPDAARKRKEAARGEAHVRRFREDSGNAGMVARELPSDEVLASWQHVEQRALDLRAAGMPGTLQELRVRAYLDLLQERDSRDLPVGPVPVPGSEPSAPPGPDFDAEPGEPGSPQGPDRPDGPDGPGENGGPGGAGHGPGGPGGSGRNGPGGPGPGPGPAPGAATGPSLAALVTITIPAATLGPLDTPGEADGFGPLDADDARDLAAAARHPPSGPAPPAPSTSR